MTFTPDHGSQRSTPIFLGHRFVYSGAWSLSAAVMAWIFIISGAPQANAGLVPYPTDPKTAMQDGTYKIDGNTVRITIEVAREESFDGPASVACTLTGCETVAGPGGKSESTCLLKWKNTERKAKTAVFTVPRDKFFAASKPIVVSLNSPKGAKLGRRSSLVAIPANAKWAEEGKALADAKGSLLLRVNESPNPVGGSSLSNKALAEASSSVTTSAGEVR